MKRANIFKYRKTIISKPVQKFDINILLNSLSTWYTKRHTIVMHLDCYCTNGETDERTDPKCKKLEACRFLRVNSNEIGLI